MRERFVKNAQREKTIPKPLLDEPQVPDYLIPFWEGYRALDRSRNIGFSVGPIPFSEIAAYLTIKGAPMGERDWFIQTIEDLDAVYLKHVEEQDMIERNRMKSERTMKRRKRD